MVTKEIFLALVRPQATLSPMQMQQFHADWQAALEAAEEAQAAMAGFSIRSTRQGLNAFFAACHHLDRILAERRIEVAQAQLALSILRVSSGKFRQAVTTFDIHCTHLDIGTKATMPATAREYLVGLELLGR